MDLRVLLDHRYDRLNHSRSTTLYVLPRPATPYHVLTYTPTFARLGVDDLIASDADEYIDISLRMGTQPDVRRDVRSRLLAGVRGMYHHEAAVGRWATMIEKMASTPPPPMDSIKGALDHHLEIYYSYSNHYHYYYNYDYYLRCARSSSREVRPSRRAAAAQAELERDAELDLKLADAADPATCHTRETRYN